MPRVRAELIEQGAKISRKRVARKMRANGIRGIRRRRGELIDRRGWQTKTEARLAPFTYIEGWYNPRRRHSALEYLSPMNFESKHATPSTWRGQHGLPTVGVCVAAATPPLDNPAPADLEVTFPRKTWTDQN